MGIISAKLIKKPRVERYCFFCPGSMVNIPIIKVFGKWPEGDSYTIYAHYDCALEYWYGETKIWEALK